MESFQEIYEAYSRKVYGFLLNLSRSESMAEELLQETFFQAYQHMEKFEGRCSIYTWLCQIGKNAFLKEIKRKKRYADCPLEHIPHTSSPNLLDEQYIQKEDYQLARQAMLALEEPYQNVFILHALSEIKLKEIASLYGKSESWARVTYFRARGKIIEEVNRHVKL